MSSLSFPLLVIPDHKSIHSQIEEDDPTIPITSPSRSLYCMLQKQPLQYQINLPSQFHLTQRFCGSSYGWLITSTVDDQNMLHISLFKPNFSKNPNPNNIIMNLPPITQNLFDLVSAYTAAAREYTKNLDHYYNHYVRKAVLSCDPTSNPNDYLIMVIYGGCTRLAVIRPATDATWTYIDEYIPGAPVEDVIYYKDKIYAVDCCGKVACCDDIFNGDNGTWRMVSSNQDLGNLPIMQRYLVESAADGELLQVVRYSDSKSVAGSSQNRTREFKIYKLMMHGDGCEIDEWFQRIVDDDECECCKWTDEKWVEMKSIGDIALFLGDNHSTSVRALELDGCCSNSIYFTANADEAHPFFDPLGYTDKGVFHLEDGIIEPISYTTRVMNRQPPIWITTVPPLQSSLLAEASQPC